MRKDGDFPWRFVSLLEGIESKYLRFQVRQNTCFLVVGFDPLTGGWCVVLQKKVT